MLVRDRQDLQRAAAQPLQVQRQRPELEARDRAHEEGSGAEPLEEAAVVQHLDDLTDQAVGFGDLAGLGEPVQHHRVNPCKTKLAGQHQPVGAGAGDHHITSHHIVSLD